MRALRSLLPLSLALVAALGLGLVAVAPGAAAAAGAAATAAPLAAAVDAPSALEGIDEQITSIMAEWKLPGLAVAAIQDGSVVLARGYGWRDVEHKLPVTEHTLFAIGSNSKSFTATLLGMLNDDGKIDWDTPVREYLSDFQLHDRVASEQMTPRDLVTHRSGLPRHDLLWYATGASRRELYERLRYLEPSEPFRAVFQYQNLMFMTAGYLAGWMEDSSWEELTRKRILDPLGMVRTNFSVEEMPDADDFAYPYSEVEDEVKRIPYRNIDEVGPAGSINSSVAEMIRYVQFHLDYGKVGDRQLLSERNARQMQTPQMVMTGPIAARISGGNELGDPSYGLGLMVSTYRGHKHVLHGGGIDGFISAMEWLPHDRIGVVVLSNFSGNNPVPGLVSRVVFDRLLGLEPIDWAARTRERQAKAEAAEEESKAKEAADRKTGTSPSHALAEYAAHYEHPAYGLARIEVAEEALELSVVGFTAPLEHHHYDIFAVPEELPPPVGQMGGTKVSFFYNKRGDIDRLAIPLESSVADIVFTRVADESMRQRAFLEAFVGAYELAGNRATVELVGEDSLRLTVPGQPTYTLVPDRGTTFTLKGLEGFSVEFEQPEGGGAATAAIFRQPNGTFVATRK